ncbi:hypothetical protein ACIHCX_34825 [Streptomyces sp. NPDC052043]|uniref:hypothetical protein n=1 Tax=Streptomyces sp. NPDC052043 TaxID=3365684 RepID=UPI0037CF02DC
MPDMAPEVSARRSTVAGNPLPARQVCGDLVLVADGHTTSVRSHVLAAPRKERPLIRSEKGIRWGGRPLATAA